MGGRAVRSIVLPFLVVHAVAATTFGAALGLLVAVD